MQPLIITNLVSFGQTQRSRGSQMAEGGIFYEETQIQGSNIPTLGIKALSTGVSCSSIKVPHHHSHILGPPPMSLVGALHQPKPSMPTPCRQVVKPLTK